MAVLHSQATSFHERDDDMAKTMTTSGMTEGQIGRALEILGAQLRKHAAELPTEAVQKVFGQAELGHEWLAVLRTRVEAQSNLIVRRVKVNRTRTPQEMLDATGRRQYTDRKVVDAMPHGEGEEAEVIFFKPRPESYQDGILTDEALERELDFHGLKTDPYAQAAVNEDDPAFADKKPNSTHWKEDASGKWCFAAFRRWGDGERGVYVSRSGSGWRGGWWFAGVRK